MTAINWTNMTSMADLPTLANTASGGSFWVSMLYMIWIILILLVIAYGFEIALFTSSFICLVLGLLLVYAGLVNWIYVIVFAGIILFLFLYTIFINEKR